MTHSLSVEFCGEAHRLESLHAAAYRMIGTCTCEIKKQGGGWLCVLTPTRAEPDLDTLRERFITFVADETLRTQVAQKTEGVRNLILALAFGSLVSSEAETP